MCFHGSTHIAHNQEGDSTVPLSSVYCSEDSQQINPSAPLLRWLLPNIKAVNLWSSEIWGHVRTCTPLRHSNLEEEKPFLHRSTSFKEQAAFKLGMEAQRRADVLGQPSRPLIDQDEGTMTLDNKHGQLKILSRNRKGAMWDKVSGKSKLNSIERAQMTRLQRKLLLGAGTCCVCVGR